MLGGSGMKTKEFMAKVRSLEFGIIQEGHQLVVRTPGCSIVARVNRPSQQTEIVTFTFGSADRRELLNIISEYTGTPPEEREEEKRYWLRIVANLGFMDDQRFLNLNIEREEYFICSARQSEWVKTIFTESEIAEMDITGFQKVEVTE